MRKYLALTLLLLCIGTAAAQQKERTIKEPRIRFGVGYRFSLGLTEQIKAKSDEYNASAWGSPLNRCGGDLHLEGTVRLTPNWNVGLGAGLGLYDGDLFRSYRIYAKGEHLYGKTASRWFNYAEAGISAYQHQGAGFTAGLGGGYRMAITRRTRLDFTAGLEYLNIVSSATFIDTDSGQMWTEKRGGRINRIGLTLGIAMHF